MRPTIGVRTRSLSCRRAEWLAGCVWFTLTIPVLAQCPSGGGTAVAASPGTGTTTNAAPVVAAFGASPVIQLQLALQGTPQPSAQQQALMLQAARLRQQAFARQAAVARQQTLASMQARSAAAARTIVESTETATQQTLPEKKSAVRSEMTAAQRESSLRYWRSVAQSKTQSRTP